MKIVCTTENVIEKKESCRKTYCCNKMKIAMNPYKNSKDSWNWLPSNFTIEENRITITTHHNYHEGDHEMSIDFCPWCKKAVTVEHKKVDKTGIPPVRPKPAPKPPVLKTTSPPPALKKKHWWSK